MCRLRTATICATLIVASIAQELIVVGPNYFHSNRDYTVKIFNLNKRVKFSLHLECFGNDDIVTFENTTTGRVKSYDVESVTIKIPKISSLNSGRITISSKNKTNSYSKTVDLQYQAKYISGFIQLSKPVYKPGDSVQFRVICLDPDLKQPSGLKTVTVTVQDSVGNTIRKWANAELSNGVFEGKMYIASSPLFGMYNIEVEANNEELVSKAFVVKEYVLSTFEVHVKPTVIPLQEHQALDLTIVANYYFGKPVSGSVKIDVYDEGNKSLYKLKQTGLNGMLQVHLPFTEPLSIYETQKNVKVTVTIIEQYTNRTVFKEYQFPVYKHKYRVVPHPNSNPESALKLEHHDGTPAKGVALLIKVAGMASEGLERTSDQEGIIYLSLPSFEETQVIRILHAGKQIFITEIEKSEIQSNDWFNIKVSYSVEGNQLKLTLNYSQPLQFFIYYIVSKGSVVDAKYVTAQYIRRNEYKISILENMLPRAKIMVATMIGGIMYHDSEQIEFDAFSNKFNLTRKDAAADVKPGNQIVLEVTGPRNAYVYLASYDQSLLQHGSGHDAVSEDVWNLVDELNRGDPNTYDCFHSMVLFTLPEDNNLDCEANDKSSRNSYITAIFTNYELKWRTTFSEDWLWKNLQIPKNGKIELTEYVPDTITSWYIIGFSIDPVYGFGIIKKPIQFTTVQPFYIVDHLPYSIKRGEEVLLQFTLFSSLNQILISDVTLYNINNQMEFIGHSGNGDNFTQSFNVPPNVGYPVLFKVKAKTLGEMIVRIKASILLEHDAIDKIIRVLPEQTEHTLVKTEFFTSDVPITRTFEIPLDIPKKADKESVRIEFSIASNIFTYVMPNLENLLSVPTGCGEQNMIRFVPNVVVLDFLYATQTNTTSVTKRVEELLRTGYQNQLKYRKADGSFAVWPYSQSSVFLTAFVGKSFHIASKYIPDDKMNVSKSFDWLATKQLPDGRFAEVGYIIHKDMQGGLRDGIALTSYVMTAFLEYKSQSANHNAVIEKGMAYIAKHIDSITDSYDLSIATYAMWLNNHSKKSLALDKLKRSSRTESNENLRYWPRKTSQIETTAYALLSLVEAQEYTTALATAHWLFNQTYETGSFPRTQDTFVGLKALAKFSERFNQPSTKNDYKVELRAPGINTSFAIQSSENKTYSNIPSNVRKMHLRVTGEGTGLLRVTYKYLLDLMDFDPRFNITVEKQFVSSESALKLKICSKFLPENPGERSNMALVEVTFPSGYVADTESNSALKRAQRIQNVEYLHGGTMVVVYYNNMGDDFNCFWIKAYMRYKVALRRPAYVKVHDYYEPKYKAIHAYEIHE